MNGEGVAKGTDFTKLTQTQIQAIEDNLNQRPRKCLSYKIHMRSFQKKPAAKLHLNVGGAKYSKKAGGIKNMSVRHFFIALPLFLFLLAMVGLEIWAGSKLHKPVDFIYGSSSKDDGFDAVAALPDNGLIVAGHEEGRSRFAQKVWLIRLDKNGKIVWEKFLSGYNRSHFGHIRNLPDGTLLASGSYYTLGRGWRGFLVRLNRHGKIIWEKRLTNVPRGEFQSFAALANGEAVVTGVLSQIEGKTNWIIKLSKNGKKLWEKRWSPASGDIRFSALTILPDKSIVAVGQKFRKTKNCHLNENDLNKFINCINTHYSALAVKLSKEGKTVWEKNFPGKKNSFFTSIVPLPEGGLLLAGPNNVAGLLVGGLILKTPSLQQSVRFVRLDDKGNNLWEKDYLAAKHHLAGEKTLFSGMTLLPSGRFAVVGSFLPKNGGSQEGLGMIMDQQGRVIWEKTGRPRRIEPRTLDLSLTELVLPIIPFADHFWTFLRFVVGRSELKAVTLMANGDVVLVGRVWGQQSWNGWLRIIPRALFSHKPEKQQTANQKKAVLSAGHI